MIPTPQRQAANRRWSAVLAAMAAATIAAVGFTVRLGPVAEGVGIGLALIVAAAMYHYGTRVMRRRRAVLRRGLDPHITDILQRRVSYYRGLGDAGKQRFDALAAIFLDETAVTGAGCEIDDETRALVAASAVIPIMGFPDWEYATLREVLVRPDEFVAPAADGQGDSDPLLGMVASAGGAFHGTLILSREDLEAGFARPGQMHVGIHEFAHLIDEGDGAIDGIPAWLPRQLFRDWLRLVRRQLDAGRPRRRGHSFEDPGHEESPLAAADEARREDREDWSDMPAYAFTNEQEFFAVSAEYFFQAPRRLAARHPKLYDILRQTFRQDPAARQ